MEILKIIICVPILIALVACGAEEGTATADPEPRGVISNSQQQALDAANTVEQTLLDAAAQREKELQERLQR